MTLLIVASAVHAADFVGDLEQFDREIRQSSGILAASAVIDFAELEDSLEIGIVGRYGSHVISFLMADSIILPGGALTITFPEIFGIAEADSFEYRDDDSLNTDFTFTAFEVAGGSIRLDLDTLGTLPEYGSRIEIEIDSILSPTAPDEFTIILTSTDSTGMLIGGPTVSQAFSTEPDELASIQISPSNVQTVDAGETILFGCSGRDQFDNELTGLVTSWEVVPSPTMVGEITSDGVFLAKHLGTSLVACHVDTFADTSALIYVFPGDFDRYEVSGFPDYVLAGMALEDSILIAAVDLYGNPLNDTDNSVWFVTTDWSATVSPGIDAPYAFVDGDPAEAKFPGSGFVFRSAGLQTIYLTDGSVNSAAFNIFVNSGAVHDFGVEVPSEVTAGEPFDVYVTNVKDIAGNSLDVFVEVELTESGLSPWGDTPQINALSTPLGNGSAEQVLVNAGTAQLRFTAGIVVKTSSPIQVKNANAESFEFYVSSPQYVNTPFADTAYIDVFDRFGNAAVDFDASLDTIRIEPDGSGTLTPSVIDADTAFVNGHCDLIPFGLEYEGDELYLTFAAMSDSGVTGISNTVSMHSTRLERLTIDPDQVYTGDTLTAEISVVNFGTKSAIIDDITLLSTQGQMTIISFSSDLPYSIPSQSMHINTIATKVPDSFDAGWTRFSATIVGTYDSLPLFEESGFLDSTRVLKSRSLSYDPQSFSPVVVSKEFSYPFRCRVVHSGEDNIVLDTSSYVRFASADGDTFAINLNGPAYIPAVDDPVTLFFEEQVLGSEYGSGWYSLWLSVNGLQGFSEFSDTMTLSDSVMIQTPSSLRFEERSFQPTTAFRGAEIAPSLVVVNDGEAALLLDEDQTVLRLTSGQDEIRFTPMQTDFTLDPGVNSLQFAAKTVPASFPLADNHITLDITGIDNGHSRTFALVPGENLIEFKQQATVRLLSVTGVAQNLPKVNVGQNFDIVIKVSNEGEEALEDITIALGSDGSSVFDGNLQIAGSIGVGETDSVETTVMASSSPNPAELFSAEISSATGATTGGSALVLTPIDNTVAMSIQSPAVVDLLARIDSPPNAVDGTVSIGQGFHITSNFVNRGQASVGYGTVSLLLGDTGFETTDDTSLIFAINDILGWDIVAPMIPGDYSIVVEITDIPVDSNSMETALTMNQSVTIPVVVEVEDIVLRMTYYVHPYELLSPGEEFTAIDLNLEALAGNPEAELRLDNISFRFTDRDDKAVAASDLLLEGEVLYDGGVIPGSLTGNDLVFSFGDQVVFGPEVQQQMSLRLTVDPEFGSSNFFIGLDSASVVATDVTYGIEGSQVAVVGYDGSALSMNQGYGMVANDLEASFYNYPNPFSAGREETSIVYYIQQASDVTFEIFTLIGEKVFSEEISSGNPGAVAGQKNVLIWDGRNSRGDVVRNGVYIAVLKLSNGGEVRRKIAVVK